MSDNPLTTEERLETILYQYLNLYERWSEDRQTFAKKGVELSDLITSFQNEVEQLSTLEARIQASFQKEMGSLVSAVRAQIKGVATEEAKAELQRASGQLSRVVEKTDHTLRQSFWEVAKSRWQWLGLTLVSGVLSGFLFSWCFLPVNYPFNAEQATLYSMGENLNDSLNGLSKGDQQRVMALLKKGMHAH